MEQKYGIRVDITRTSFVRIGRLANDDGILDVKYLVTITAKCCMAVY